jgi:stage III sporulation protein AF
LKILVKPVMKNLIAYMLLSALAEKLVPGKSYQRYISLTGGLIMIMLLISPLVSILGGDDSELIKKIENYINVQDDIDYSLEDIIGAADEAEGFLADKPDYEAVGNEETVKVKLRDMGAELEDLEITRNKNGEILRIIVAVTITPDAGSVNDEENQLLESVKKYISETYNLDADSIYVMVR